MLEFSFCVAGKSVISEMVWTFIVPSRRPGSEHGCQDYWPISVCGSRKAPLFKHVAALSCLKESYCSLLPGVLAGAGLPDGRHIPPRWFFSGWILEHLCLPTRTLHLTNVTAALLQYHALENHLAHKKIPFCWILKNIKKHADDFLTLFSAK